MSTPHNDTPVFRLPASDFEDLLKRADLHGFRTHRQEAVELLKLTVGEASSFRKHFLPYELYTIQCAIKEVLRDWQRLNSDALIGSYYFPRHSEVEVSPGKFKVILALGYEAFQRDGVKILVHYTIDNCERHSILTVWGNRQDEAVMKDVVRRVTDYVATHDRFMGQVITPSLQFVRLERSFAWTDLVLPVDVKTRLIYEVTVFAEMASAGNGQPTRRGILLSGQPGVGKTLAGKVIASTLGCSFIWATASTMLDRHMDVAGLFALLRKLSPSVLMLEDIDLWGYHRDGHPSPVLGEVLAQMDGLHSSAGILVLATTNAPESLDRALIRPARFDVHLRFPLLDDALAKRLITLECGRRGLDAKGVEGLKEPISDISGAEAVEVVTVAARLAHDAGHWDAGGKAQIAPEDLAKAVEMLKPCPEKAGF